MPYQNQLPPTTGPSLLDILKNLYGTNTNAPSAPTAADLAYAQAAQQADSSAGSAITNGASTVGSAINNGLNSLFNLTPQDLSNSTSAPTPDIGPTTGSGAPQGFGGAGGQATDVVPAGLLAAIQSTSQAPQATSDQLAGVVGPSTSPLLQDPSQQASQASQASPQTSVNTPIADPTSAPDVSLDANGNPIDPNALPDPQNLSNTDRESNPLTNTIGLFNQQATSLASNPNPVAAQGLLSSLGDTLGGYASKLKTLSPAASQGLITAGLGILGGNNGRQSLTQLVGQAGTQGVNAYTAAKQQALLNAQATQKQATDNAKFALDVTKAKSEADARTDNTAARQQEIAIQAQNAQTAKLKANAEMNGTAKWVTVQQPDGTYANQGYDRNGNATSIIPASADDVQKLTQGKAPTESQAKATGYAQRMAYNNKIIGDTYTSMQGPGGVWNNLAPNILKSTNYQQYQAAKDNFIASQLRQESGASIAKSEYDAADKQYFPQPGDSKDVIDQKSRLRDIATQSMATAAGPNYKPAAAPQTSTPSSSAPTTPTQQAQATAAKQAALLKYQVAARSGNVAAQQQLTQRGLSW